MKRWFFPYWAARPRTLAAGAGLLWIGLAGCACPEPASWMAARTSGSAFYTPGCSSCQTAYAGPMQGPMQGDPSYFAHLEPSPYAPQASQLRASEPHRTAPSAVARTAPLGPDAADLEKVDAHQQAVDCMKEGRFAEANQWFVEALAQKPHDPNLLCDVGYAQIVVKDFEGAEETLRGSLDIAPGNRTAQVNLALAMAAQGRIAESLLLFQRHEGKAQALASAGEAAVLGGRVDAARECFEKSLLLDPRNEVASLGLDQLPPATHFSAGPEVVATPVKAEMQPLPKPSFGPSPAVDLDPPAPMEPPREAKKPAAQPLSAARSETSAKSVSRPASPLHDGPSFGPAPLPELPGGDAELVPLEPPTPRATRLPEPTARKPLSEDAPLALASAESEAAPIPEPSARPTPALPNTLAVPQAPAGSPTKLAAATETKPASAVEKVTAEQTGAVVKAAAPTASAGTPAKGGNAFPQADAAATASAPAMRAAVARAKTTWTAAKTRSKPAAAEGSATLQAAPIQPTKFEPTKFEPTKFEPTKFEPTMPATSTREPTPLEPSKPEPTDAGLQPIKREPAATSAEAPPSAGVWRPRRSVHPESNWNADAPPTKVDGPLPHPTK